MHPISVIANATGEDEGIEKPVATIVFVPTSVALSCVALVLGIALAGCFGFNWYANHNYGKRNTSEEGRLIQLGEHDDIVTIPAAYGSTK